MRRIAIGLFVPALMVAVAKVPAAQTAQNCAAGFIIDSMGVLDENTVAVTECQPGGSVVAAVCNYDTANQHTLQMIAKMIFIHPPRMPPDSNAGTAHGILKKNIDVTVGKAMDAMTPTCVATPQQIFDATQFGTGRGQKPYGTYSYVILTDGSKAADPELDVAPPTGIEKGSARRGRGAARPR